MFKFKEGQPNAGRRHDCIKQQVLPAISQGRHVWACIEGLQDMECRLAISAHLDVPLDKVNEYLHYVAAEALVEEFKALPDPQGGWRVDQRFEGSVVVIDDAHLHYRVGDSLDPASQAFFAWLEQRDAEVIIMTSAWPRLHASLRERIQRRDYFENLAVGGLRGSYRVTHYRNTDSDGFYHAGTRVFSFERQLLKMYRPRSAEVHAPRMSLAGMPPIFAVSLLALAALSVLLGWWVG